jgi:hypothetical protein
MPVRAAFHRLELTSAVRHSFLISKSAAAPPMAVTS